MIPAVKWDYRLGEWVDIKTGTAVCSISIETTTPKEMLWEIITKFPCIKFRLSKPIALFEGETEGNVLLRKVTQSCGCPSCQAKTEINRRRKAVGITQSMSGNEIRSAALDKSYVRALPKEKKGKFNG